MSDSSPHTRIVSGLELHDTVVVERILNARRDVWIATADLKDMHIRRGGQFKPVLAVFDELAARGVHFRIVHSALPSRPFQTTLDSFPRLTGGHLELQICPRSHWKIVVVDGEFAYWGSANFTGAGLGAKSERRRNLEIGSISEEAAVVRQVAHLFDAFWMGQHCEFCALRANCPDPIV